LGFKLRPCFLSVLLKAMAKSVGAKRGSVRGQSKAPPAPPAKKAKKEASKPVVLDTENVAPKENIQKEDVSMKKEKLIVATVPSPEKKRSQMVPSDPVSQSVAIVQDALEDEAQVGLLKLPSHICEMLCIAMPTALGHGSAADERHALQMKIADTIGSYLRQVVVIYEDWVKEKEELVQAANMAKEQGLSALAALQAKLEEKVLQVKEKQGNLDTAKQELSSAKERVPQKEIDALNAELQQLCSQRDQYQEVLTSSFDVLKACDWSSATAQQKGEKKLYGPLNTLVKQIGADPSLVEAASTALAKNPAQRGDFDVMVVGQLESVLRQPLTVLDEQIRQHESIKEEKDAQMQEGNAAIVLAEDKLRCCEEELKACKEEQRELEAGVQEMTGATKDPDQMLEQARSAYDAKLSLLEQASKSLVAFRFLDERRVTPLPEPASPVAMETEEAPAAIESEAAPAAVDTEAAPAVVETYVTPAVVETDAAPAVVETEGAPAVVESEAESAVVGTEAAPAVMETEAAPAVMETEASPAEVASAVLAPEEMVVEEVTDSTMQAAEAESPEFDAAMPSVDVESPEADVEMSTADVESPPADVEEVVRLNAFSMPIEEEPKVENFSNTTEAEMEPSTTPSRVVTLVQNAFAMVFTRQEAVSVPQVAAADMPDADVSTPAEQPSAEEEAEVEAPAEEPAEEPEEVDPCWDFVRGLDPGSDPFSDKKSSSKDSSTLKQECRDLKAVAVTTEGRIKFSLPPRKEWVPPRDDNDDFGTWVWKGDN